jgi:NAD(P)-dependent dehydrogenase (short-subunit alcohol dehydrogenase family)
MESVQMMGNLEIGGLRVLLTGASRGIGAATARVLVAGGAQVALMARDGGAITALAQDLGTAALALPGNLASWDETAAVVARAESAMGGIDVLIGNGAVIGPLAPIAQTDPADWARTQNVNLTGAYHAIRAVLPGMLAQGGGTVITVSSGAAYRPVDGWSAYCASKAGAAMLMRSLDLDYHAQGIRSLGLSPGTVATDMQRAIRTSGMGPVAQLDWSAHIPPEWAGLALAWLSSPAVAAEFAGQDVSLRDAAIRTRLGLPAA